MDTMDTSNTVDQDLLPLTMVVADYDRTRPLLDGRVQPDGIKLDAVSGRIGDFCMSPVYEEYDIAEMSLSLYAAERGFLQDVEIAKVGSFEQALISYFQREHAALLAKINEKGDFNDEIDAGIKAGIEKFKATQTW